MNSHLEPPPVQPRGMGCLGKGCLILSIFVLFLIVAGAVGIYFGLKKNSAILRGLYWAESANILASEPSPVTQFETTKESIEVSDRKWEDFERAAHAGQPAHVELTADDLNNFIASNPHLRGKAFVTVENNRMHVQASLPLKEYLGREGYYLSGNIVIQTNGPSTLDHPPLSSITINGHALPSDLLNWKFRSRALSDYAQRHNNRVNTVEIRDGKIILEKSAK